MMRVVNERKWRRAKLQVLLANTVAILWCIGSLQGKEPMPYPTATLALLLPFICLAYNLVKRKTY